jgi:hypothetical protein
MEKWQVVYGQKRPVKTKESWEEDVMHRPAGADVGVWAFGFRPDGEGIDARLLT